MFTKFWYTFAERVAPVVASGTRNKPMKLKLTKRRLRQIIKEEISKLLQLTENDLPISHAEWGPAMKSCEERWKLGAGGRSAPEAVRNIKKCKYNECLRLVKGTTNYITANKSKKTKLLKNCAEMF